MTIAIINSGVDFHQPDLADKLVVGANIISFRVLFPRMTTVMAPLVASVAAALTNNRDWGRRCVVGARIMPVKVLGPGGGRLFSCSHRNLLCRRQQHPGDKP